MNILSVEEVLAMVSSNRFVAVGVAISVATIYHISRGHLERRERERRHDEAIAKALEKRAKSIEWAKEVADSIRPEEREKVLKLSYEELKVALRDGRVSCVAALCAYVGAALAAHKKTNCAVLFIVESIDKAKELDNQKKEGVAYPPLFGIPISVKESVPMAGQTASRGLVSRLGMTGKDDAQLVEVARKSGAIPFVLTNVPTSLMATTTINAVYGATKHPLDATRSSGGSSGGEGAIIGAGGSLLGIGSDMAGSIRIPAAYSGCAGFKPSSVRQTNKHYGEPWRGRPFVMASDGPMASTMQGCVDILRVAWSPDESTRINGRDAYTNPTPFNEERFRGGRKLRIGFWSDHPTVRPLPAMARAVRLACTHLERAGHTLIPFTPPSLHRSTLLFVSLFGLDNFTAVAKMLANDRVPPEFSTWRRILGMGPWTKWMVGHLARLMGNIEGAESMLSFTATPAEVRDRIDELYAWRRAVADAMREEEIDCLLSYPVLSPALKLASPIELPHEALAPTLIYNLLDFGAGVVQVSSWCDDDDRSREKYEPRNQIERAIWRDTKDAAGLSLAVQIAAPPYRDELALRALCDLEKEVKGSGEKENNSA